MCGDPIMLGLIWTDPPPKATGNGGTEAGFLGYNRRLRRAILHMDDPNTVGRPRPAGGGNGPARRPNAGSKGGAEAGLRRDYWRIRQGILQMDDPNNVERPCRVGVELGRPITWKRVARAVWYRGCPPTTAASGRTILRFD